MDPNAKPTSPINATDSSASSLSFSFEPIEINSHDTGGPINSLPNELIQLIMVKLALDGDVKRLVRLRLVSTRWNSLVEHYCRNKKLLLVNCKCFSNPGPKNYAPLIVRLKTDKFFGKILKLLPNIEQLGIAFYDFRDDTQARAFYGCINSLNSLKQLELSNGALKALPHLSKTLSQLEHIGLFAKYDILDAGDFLHFVRDLGPNCSRVFIVEGLKLAYNNIVKCLNIKPNLFANLTHLRLFISRGSTQVVHLLSEQATALEFLYFETRDVLSMSPNVIRDFGKLFHLIELKIWMVEMDIAELDEARLGLTSLTSVATCELFAKFGLLKDGHKFTRVLSIIFPKLINLNLYIVERLSTSELFLNEIKQNVHRFSHLRKHKIDIF